MYTKCSNKTPKNGMLQAVGFLSCSPVAAALLILRYFLFLTFVIILKVLVV
jgi:hypothetical protein